MVVLTLPLLQPPPPAATVLGANCGHPQAAEPIDLRHRRTYRREQKEWEPKPNERGGLEIPSVETSYFHNIPRIHNRTYLRPLFNVLLGGARHPPR